MRQVKIDSHFHMRRADKYRLLDAISAMHTKPKCSALAIKIANSLMKSEFGKAKRLQLRGPHEEDLGGYCRMMVERIIDGHLTDARRLKK